MNVNAVLVALVAMLASPAFADAPAQGGSPYGSIIMMLGFALIFYFMLWRPQSKRAKDHRDLLSQLSKGDEVVTAGGMVGKIVRISDGFVVLNVAEEMELTVQKQSISTTLPKGTIKSI